MGGRGAAQGRRVRAGVSAISGRGPCQPAAAPFDARQPECDRGRAEAGEGRL